MEKSIDCLWKTHQNPQDQWLPFLSLMPQEGKRKYGHSPVIQWDSLLYRFNFTISYAMHRDILMDTYMDKYDVCNIIAISILQMINDVYYSLIQYCVEYAISFYLHRRLAHPRSRECQTFKYESLKLIVFTFSWFFPKKRTSCDHAWSSWLYFKASSLLTFSSPFAPCPCTLHRWDLHGPALNSAVCQDTQSMQPTTLEAQLKWEKPAKLVTSEGTRTPCPFHTAQKPTCLHLAFVFIVHFIFMSAFTPALTDSTAVTGI